jgi:hypothetical protein
MGRLPAPSGDVGRNVAAGQSRIGRREAASRDQAGLYGRQEVWGSNSHSSTSQFNGNNSNEAERLRPLSSNEYTFRVRQWLSTNLQVRNMIRPIGGAPGARFAQLAEVTACACCWRRSGPYFERLSCAGAKMGAKQLARSATRCSEITRAVRCSCRVAVGSRGRRGRDHDGQRDLSGGRCQYRGRALRPRAHQGGKDPQRPGHPGLLKRADGPVVQRQTPRIEALADQALGTQNGQISAPQSAASAGSELRQNGGSAREYHQDPHSVSDPEQGRASSRSSRMFMHRRCWACLPLVGHRGPRLPRVPTMERRAGISRSSPVLAVCVLGVSR